MHITRCETKGFDPTRRKNNIKQDASSFSVSAKECARKLKGCNVVVVGDSTRGNASLASSLAQSLRYVPLDMEELVHKTMARRSDAFERSDDAWEDAVHAEVLLLEEVAYTARCVVGTLGNGGAAARGDFWRFLFGSYTIWLEFDGEDEDLPQREAYSMSEVHVKVKRQPGLSEIEAARAAASVALDKLNGYLEENDDLAQKKSLYLRLGCRGDWPDLREPGWTPPEITASLDTQPMDQKHP